MGRLAAHTDLPVDPMVLMVQVVGRTDLQVDHTDLPADPAVTFLLICCERSTAQQISCIASRTRTDQVVVPVAGHRVVPAEGLTDLQAVRAGAQAA